MDCSLVLLQSAMEILDYKKLFVLNILTLSFEKNN